MKVYVVTKREYLKPEQYFTVKATMTEAMEIVFAECENAKMSIQGVTPTKFLGRDKCGNLCMMFIYEETI